MEEEVVDTLSKHGLMTIATLRADGWPQATMISYANEGMDLYFIISKASQKYANIERDSRVSIVVGKESENLAEMKALSIAANASEIRDPSIRDRAVDLILRRHPALARLPSPEFKHSAVMRAYCSIVTVVDYSKGLGHVDLLRVGPKGAEVLPAGDDDWGYLAATR